MGEDKVKHFFKKHEKMGFQYEDERHASEHRYVRFGLLLAALPLILTMLGMPMFRSTGSMNPYESDMMVLDSEDQYVLIDSFVPRGWARRPKYVEQQPFCELVPPPNVNGKIRFIRVVGERHSGVDGIVRLLSDMFPNVTVGSGFARGKYWFQDQAVLPNHINLDEVLVVVVMRNSYDWLRMMRRNPIHAPRHSFKHDWRRFVTKLWITRTSSIDNKLSATPGVKCQAKYLAGQVKPCRQSRVNFLGTTASKNHHKPTDPVYEMNPITGLPFGNILELRKFKMLNYANMTTWVPHISYVKVENLLREDGVEKLRNVLRKSYSLASCEKVGGQPLKFKDSIGAAPRISEQEIDYVNCNLDWSAESIFAYHRRDLPDASLSLLNEPCTSDPFADRFVGKTFDVDV